MAERDDETALRCRIDAALRRARRQWDPVRPTAPASDDVVLLISTLDEATLTIRVPRRCASERARELVGAGWNVEMRDGSGAVVGADASTPVRASSLDDVDRAIELLEDADLPTRPQPDVGVLRQSA